MRALLGPTAFVVSMTGCFLDSGRNADVHADAGDGNHGSDGGSRPPPPIVHGKQTMSDVHLEPSGDQVWIIHSAVADVNATPKVTTAHFGAYVPANGTFVDVLDTTGTLGKKILFPANDRVLLVTQRGTSQDVFVTIDTVARRPLNQHTYPGDRTNFRMSPTGRAVIASNATDAMIHIVDTASLVDQALPGTTSAADAAWASTEDVLYMSQLQAGSTRIQRFDLRTADLAKPIAQPELVATIPGGGQALVVSPDDRFAALQVTSFSTGQSQIAMIDLATATLKTIAGDARPAFTSDNRVIVWQPAADGTHDLRIVTPATGVATPAVATSFHLPPVSLPLRRHDLVIATPFLFESVPAFLYGITDRVRTPMSSPVSPTTMFERPGHAELWMWSEYDDTLERLDLSTGTVVDVVSGVDSVDYRAAADDIVIGTFDHSVRRLSMATAQSVGTTLVLADPNDAAAPYKLGTN